MKLKRLFSQRDILSWKSTEQRQAALEIRNKLIKVKCTLEVVIRLIPERLKLRGPQKNQSQIK